MTSRVTDDKESFLCKKDRERKTERETESEREKEKERERERERGRERERERFVCRDPRERERFVSFTCARKSKPEDLATRS